MRDSLRLHGMKTLLALAAALTATALSAPLAPVSSSAAADTVDLSRTGALERGDDIRIAHLEGTTIVDGDRRIEVPRVMTLMGTSGDDYVVSTRRATRPRYQVKRISADGHRTLLLRGRDALYTQLSGDGTHVIHNDNQRRTRITAYDATDGSEVAHRTFRGYAEVVDADGGTVLVTSWQRQRTVAWDLATGARERIADRVGYQADLLADRLAVYTDDPYRGGCTWCRPCPTPAPGCGVRADSGSSPSRPTEPASPAPTSWRTVSGPVRSSCARPTDRCW